MTRCASLQKPSLQKPFRLAQAWTEPAEAMDASLKDTVIKASSTCVAKRGVYVYVRT